MKFLSTSTQETLEIGKQIASTLQGGDVVLLEGNLGAGKTTLTKGIAQGLGIREDITSPTFTLMNIYPCNQNSIKQVVHIDTYRMEDAQDLLDIGVEDYLEATHTVTLIEWPEKIESLLRGNKIKKINIEYEDQTRRTITFEDYASPHSI